MGRERELLVLLGKTLEGGGRAVGGGVGGGYRVSQQVHCCIGKKKLEDGYGRGGRLSVFFVLFCA